jgi:hypothetical protein
MPPRKPSGEKSPDDGKNTPRRRRTKSASPLRRPRESPRRAPGPTPPKSRKSPTPATPTVKKSSKKDSINLAKTVKQELLNDATSGTTPNTSPRPPIETETPTYQTTWVSDTTLTHAPERVTSAAVIKAAGKKSERPDDPHQDKTTNPEEHEDETHDKPTNYNEHEDKNPSQQQHTITNTKYFQKTERNTKKTDKPAPKSTEKNVKKENNENDNENHYTTKRNITINGTDKQKEQTKYDLTPLIANPLEAPKFKKNDELIAKTTTHPEQKKKQHTSETKDDNHNNEEVNTTKQKLETIEQKENKEEIRNILDLLRKSHTNREKNNNKDEEELISDTSETTIINDKDKPTETHTQKKETDEKTKNHPNEDNNNNQLKAQHIKRDTKQKQHINEPNDEHDIGKISYNFTEIQESKNITQKNSKTTELEKIFKNTTQQRTEISLHNEGIKTTKPIDFTYKQQNKSNEQLKKQTNDNNPPHTNLTETFTRKNFLPNIQKQEKEHHDYYKNNESHDETKKKEKGPP